MAKIHALKTVDPYFSMTKNGMKTFELRKNDRDFAEGDLLILQHWIEEEKRFTGDQIVKKIDFVLSDFKGLSKGYVILQISDVKVSW